MDMIESVTPADFKLFTGLLKTSRSADGKMRLHGVASSTTKDLHGDVMRPSAIEDMEHAANNNLTIFLNHEYRVPEDVGGSVEKARSITRGVDHEGNPNVDLDFDILINDTNPRAVQAFDAIERGTKLGLSIGAMIPPGGATKNKSDGSWVIDHVDLLETSIVSLPANPRSWVEYAVKALNAKTKDKTQTIPLGAPTLTLTDTDYEIRGSLEGMTWGSDGQTSTNTINSTIVNGTATTVVVDAVPEVIEPDVIDEVADPDVTPDVTDATVTVIQIDTGDGDAASDESSQEASDSGPGNEEGGLLDETADGDDAALGDDTTRAVEPTLLARFSETAALLLQATRDLGEVRAALVVAETARGLAERDRDQANSERDRVLRETKDILDRVADSPVVRRAVAVDAQRDFRTRFGGIYSEDFLKTLERAEHGG